MMQGGRRRGDPFGEVKQRNQVIYRVRIVSVEVRDKGRDADEFRELALRRQVWQRHIHQRALKRNMPVRRGARAGTMKQGQRLGMHSARGAQLGEVLLAIAAVADVVPRVIRLAPLDQQGRGAFQRQRGILLIRQRRRGEVADLRGFPVRPILGQFVRAAGQQRTSPSSGAAPAPAQGSPGRI